LLNKGGRKKTLAVTTLGVFRLYLSVLLPVSGGGGTFAQPLQHRGCAESATAWGFSPKNKSINEAVTLKEADRY